MAINLSENEKRDIVKYLEADKPLPDKYRFSLFKNSEEISTKVLSLEAKIKKLKDHKKYGLVWEDKPEDVVEICKTNIPILKEIKNKEIITDENKPVNILIEGDNYHSLSVLNYTHKGKIDVIYIDPPYNTGNKDFIYNDKFVDKEDSFRHSKWLSFMEKRLMLAKSLLSQNGIIFISIDDNEQAPLKLLCNEVFGESNFIESFIWSKKNSAKGVPPRNMVVNVHENILCYSNGADAKLLGELRTDETFSNPDNDVRGLWRRSNIKSTLENEKNKFTIIDPLTGNGFTNYWSFSQKTLERMIGENRILFPKKITGLPKQKEFLKEFSNTRIPIMSDFGLFHSQDATERMIDRMMENKFFIYRKPLDLIKKIIEQGCIKKEITILDFFAGSGTTGHAVLKLNQEDGGKRQFILCTNNENKICEEVTYKRLKGVIKGYKDITNEKIEGLGGNLKYYKTTLIPKSYNRDEMKIRITEECTEMLCIREGVYEEKKNKSAYKIFKQGDKILAVYYFISPKELINLKKDLDRLNGEKVLYCFTLDSLGLNENDFENWQDVRLEAIPQKILDIYKEIHEY